MVFFKNPKFNRSTFFVLPVVNFPKKFHKTHLINTYIYCNKFYHKDDVFRIYIHITYNAQLINLLKLYNIVEVYHIDKVQCIVCCTINRTYYNDLIKFVEGRYSQFSELYKKRIKEYYRMFNASPTSERFKTTTTFKILYPSDEDRLTWAVALDAQLNRDAEIYSIPNKQQETLVL